MKSRVESFSILNWLGVPIELNPIQLALQGFECVGPLQIKCTSCEAAITYSETIQFCTNQTQIDRALLQTREAHLPSCCLTKPNLTNWREDGIWDLRQLFLYCKEIIDLLSKSYTTEVKFNLHAAMALVGEDLLKGKSKLEQGQLLMAIFGWVQEEGSLRCISCHRKINIELVNANEDLEFSPKNSHLSHCLYVNEKESATQIVQDLLLSKLKTTPAKLDLGENQKQLMIQNTSEVEFQKMQMYIKNKVLGKRTRQEFNQQTDLQTLKQILVQRHEENQARAQKLRQVFESIKGANK